MSVYLTVTRIYHDRTNKDVINNKNMLDHFSTQCRFLIPLLLMAILLAFNLHREESFAMASSLIQMEWEWRAEQTLEQRLGLRVKSPETELKGVKEGTLVAVGIIGQNVVCLATAPAEVTGISLAGWLPAAPCP